MFSPIIQGLRSYYPSPLAARDNLLAAKKCGFLRLLFTSQWAAINMLRYSLGGDKSVINDTHFFFVFSKLARKIAQLYVKQFHVMWAWCGHHGGSSRWDDHGCRFNTWIHLCFHFRISLHDLTFLPAVFHKPNKVNMRQSQRSEIFEIVVVVDDVQESGTLFTKE